MIDRFRAERDELMVTALALLAAVAVYAVVMELGSEWQRNADRDRRLSEVGEE
jgi:hypothetical protein